MRDGSFVPVGDNTIHGFQYPGEVMFAVVAASAAGEVVTDDLPPVRDAKRSVTRAGATELVAAAGGGFVRGPEVEVLASVVEQNVAGTEKWMIARRA